MSDIDPKPTLKKLCEERGYTQVKLAELSGIATKTIQNIQAKKHKPQPDTTTLLAKVFGMQPDEIDWKIPNSNRVCWPAGAKRSLHDDATYRRKPEAKYCKNCYIQLPTSGKCDDCS